MTKRLLVAALSGITVGIYAAILEKLLAGESFVARWFYDYSLTGLVLGLPGGLVMGVLASYQERYVRLLGGSCFCATVCGACGLAIGLIVGDGIKDAIGMGAVLLCMGVVLGTAFGAAYAAFWRLLSRIFLSESKGPTW